MALFFLVEVINSFKELIKLGPLPKMKGMTFSVGA